MVGFHKKKVVLTYILNFIIYLFWHFVMPSFKLHGGLFIVESNGRGVEVRTHLHLVLRLKYSELSLRCPIYLHGLHRDSLHIVGQLAACRQEVFFQRYGCASDCNCNSLMSILQPFARVSSFEVFFEHSRLSSTSMSCFGQ